MNTRPLFFWISRVPPKYMFGFIVGTAAITTVCITQHLSNIEQNYNNTIAQINDKNKVVMTKVLVCAHDIREGAEILPDDVMVKEIAQKPSPDVLSSESQAIGQIAKFSIPAGEMIGAHDLTQHRQAVGFQAKLHSGERAVTFAVDGTSGVAGFVAPDSHVDILAQAGAGADSKSTPILSDIRVVAVGTIFQKQAGESAAQPVSSVTVAVSPVDARKLVNAMSAGRIFLTLRSDSDHSPIAVSDINALFPRQAPVAETISAVPLPPPHLPPLTLPPPPEEPSTDQRLLHEVDMWQGNKKDHSLVEPGL